MTDIFGKPKLINLYKKTVKFKIKFPDIQNFLYILKIIFILILQLKFYLDHKLQESSVQKER